jgi:hypothetical protein
MTGFYRMQHGWLDHEVFRGDPLCVRAAWVWLIDKAAWKPTKTNANGHVIELRRGELLASVRFLATAWKWHRSRVERYLTSLSREGMIETEARHGINIITICNYDKYQAIAADSETLPETRPRHDRDTTETNKKEGNELKEGKRESSPRGDFELWWKAYPHKVGKEAARQKYRLALARASPEELLAGVQRYVADKPPDRPWCNPATWLHQSRWLDEPAPPVANGHDRQIAIPYTAALPRRATPEEIAEGRRRARIAAGLDP